MNQIMNSFFFKYFQLASDASIQEVHIIEPKWSDVRITQVIGRSIRELGRN